MDAFGEQLIPFGEAMMLFSQAVRGLDANVIVESATAGKALIELANTVPNSGGVVGFFTGENDMGAFGENLVPFGNGDEVLLRCDCRYRCGSGYEFRNGWKSGG